MGPPAGPQNDWERWRGGTDARVQDSEDNVDALWQARKEDQAVITALEKAVVELKTKLALLVGVAAFAGGVAGKLVPWFLSKI